MKTTSYKSEVTDISRFLDETYPVTLPGKVRFYGDKKLQVGWASIAFQKFTERVNVLIKGGKVTRGSQPEIKRAIAQAVRYGNAALIIDRSTGLVRVSPAKTSYSTVDSWGQATYVEELAGGDLIVGIDGELWLQPIKADSEPIYLDAFYTSIFYKSDNEHPFGQSRLTPASRTLIRAKSRNLMRREITADQGSYPQVILNGLWEDADASLGASVAQVIGGTHRIAGVPKDPDTDEKLDIEQLTQVSPDPLLAHDSSLARDFCSIQNFSPAELGEPSALTAEAIASLKESLILEVQDFEIQISRELENFLVELATVWGEPAPEIAFGDPEVITKAAAMDAATKASSIWPQFKYSREAAREAGLGDAVLSELFDEDGEAVIPDEEELLSAAGGNSGTVLSDF